ncbi:MAG: hypothetical protein QOI62_4018 [Solirubrobacteraceae bacterium]|jgi:hypothetical protein|nr:hypothetical protein [Solirubrobacteraceae bacterium]
MRQPTRPHQPALALTALALACALALGACGGHGATSKASASKRSNGPVEDQLGFDSAGIMARESRVEADIGRCMRAQGFDYVPIDPFAQRAAVTGASRLSDQDFLEQFGYGISTLWDRGGVQADPNQRLRAGLGTADRRAYDRALWGEDPGATFQAAVDSGDFTKLGGCTRKATETVFGGAQVLTELQGKLDQLDERINSDQRMVRALGRWTTCMAGAGYRYNDPDDIDADITKRMERIVGPVPGPFATGPAPGVPPPPYDHAALATLQRDEVQIARADDSCERRYIAPVESVVRPQYEAQFRQRNQQLIGAVKPVR